MNPEYPIYIISKGRWESRLTVKSLQEMRVPFHIVIEPQEMASYAEVIPESYIYTLPFSNLGQGSIPARNWVWEHALTHKHERHWILDDNIQHFYRMNNRLRIRVSDGIIFKIAEDFVERYQNVALAGFNYSMFGVTGLTAKGPPPVIFNTRIYSCILIKNDLPYRWHGRYNEDTDLSLRVLKDRWCTVLFNAFLCGKKPTMTMRGGNTEDLYKLSGEEDGRLLMAQSLQRQHPDVVTITRKWGRWQHQVDYRGFKKNRLIKKPDIVITDAKNEYGIKLIQRM